MALSFGTDENGNLTITPEAAERRRTLAQAMLARGMDSSPVGAWTQAAARVADALVGSLQRNSADSAEDVARKSASSRDRKMLTAAISRSGSSDVASNKGDGEVSSTMTMPSTTAGIQFDSTDPGGMPGGMLNKDYKGPLPIGADVSDEERDKMIRTNVGEANGEPMEGKIKVGQVMLKRHLDSGKPMSDVLTPSQFEPLASRADELSALDPNSDAYKSSAYATDKALHGGADPATMPDHFYSPTAQAAMGRGKPAWDNGTGEDIGKHRFLQLNDIPKVASNDPSEPMRMAPPDEDLQPSGGAKKVAAAMQTAQNDTAGTGDALPPQLAGYMETLDDRYSSEGAKAFAKAMLEKQLMPKDPTFSKIGQDAMGREQYGFVDPVHKKVTPYGGAASGANPQDDLSGDALLQSLDPNTRQIVKDFANYDADPTKIASLRGNRREILIALAQRVNPELVPGNYANIYATRHGFGGGGKDSQNLRSANQALHHLGVLMDKWDALNKSGPSPASSEGWAATFGVAKPYNKMRIGYLEQAANPALKGAEAPTEGVATEIAKLFHGVGAVPESQISEWKHSLSLDMSPEEQKGAGLSVVQMLAGGIKSYRDKYDNAVGPAYAERHPFESVFKLDKDAIATLKRFDLTPADVGLEGEVEGNTPPATEKAAPPAAAAHTPEDIEAEIKRRGLQ